MIDNSDDEYEVNNAAGKVKLSEQYMKTAAESLVKAGVFFDDPVIYENFHLIKISTAAILTRLRVLKNSDT